MGLLKRLLGRDKASVLTCSAVVPAAGRSVRMGEDKLLLPLGETPVILRTLRALESSPYITEIIVAAREEQIVPLSQLCKEAGLEKVRKIVVGGETRSASVLAGIREADSAAELIAVHDADRPLVTVEVINAAIELAAQRGAAAPAVPVKDTIKRAVGGVVTETPDRSEQG